MLSLSSSLLLSLSLSLSPHTILFVPRGTYSCKVSTESLYFSRLAANLVPRALFLGFGKAPWGRGWVSRFSLPFFPQLPSCFCSFLFNRSPPGDLWFSFSSFYSGAQVIAMLQLLFWSCLSICPIIFCLRCFTSLLIVFHVCSFVGFFVDTCFEIHPLLCRLPCSFSRFQILTAGLALPVFYTTTVLFFQRCFFKRQILFTLKNHYHYNFILFISIFLSK